ncbi:MAG: hypothetical protein JJE22_17390 [Bacteroidia bacterium]|nr:hypothetical protein [Bacteroidia bacterium]
MKNLRTSLLYAGIAFCSLSASAQIQTVRGKNPDFTKLILFQNLPEKTSVNINNLNVLLNTAVGKAVSINLSDKSQFQFEGQVVSASNNGEDNVQSMIIRSTNYDGARFTLSRIINADGAISYSGRILSFHHDDLLELKKQDGHYVLVKRKYNDLVNE